MNKLGVHMLVYGEGWDAVRARETMRRAGGAGYDLVEVLIDDPATVDPQVTALAAEETGIGVTAAGMTLDDPENRIRP
jgi:D-psicose/D-tagatose/L-ribulose 3-epimerase